MKKPRTPLAVTNQAQITNLVFRVLTGIAVDWMHELVMCRIESVFDRPLVIERRLQVNPSRPPAVVVEFGNLHHRRALVLRQVAKKRKHDAVFFLHGVGINSCPTGYLGFRTQRWDAMALAFSSVLPTVIGTLDAITLNLAIRKRTPAVDTSIGQALCVAAGIPEQDKILAEHTNFDGLVGQLTAQNRWIPEIDVHRSSTGI